MTSIQKFEVERIDNGYILHIIDNDGRSILDRKRYFETVEPLLELIGRELLER